MTSDVDRKVTTDSVERVFGSLLRWFVIALFVEIEQAVRESAVQRFRPIFLTSATTFLGLAPLISARSAQAAVSTGLFARPRGQKTVRGR